MSCQTVVNSRVTAFTSDLAQLGVKTSSVLNSLTSPGMLAASLATLQIGGQFVEIGKRDIWSAARVAQDRPDVSYHFVAVDFLPKNVIQHSLQGIARGLSQGSLQPLPQVLHRVHDAQAAFRQMSQARHVGKIAIQTQQAQHAQHKASTAAVSGLTVITGGLGTLGSMVADWMSSRQQDSLCLVGRSGRFTSSSVSVTKLLQSHSSAEVIIAKADASVQDEMHSLVDELVTGQQTARQLQGLIHSGGALADAALTKQTLQVSKPNLDAAQASTRLRQKSRYLVLYNGIYGRKIELHECHGSWCAKSQVPTFAVPKSDVLRAVNTMHLCHVIVQELTISSGLLW